MTTDEIVQEIMKLLSSDYPVDSSTLKRMLKMRINKIDGPQIQAALRLAQAKRLISICGTVVSRIGKNK